MNVYSVIKSPYISEKASLLADSQSQYIFQVNVVATKKTVKKAVEDIFGVKVLAVNIVNSKGKTKTFRGKKGKRSNFKKAIVSLEKGQDIDFVGKV